MDAWEVLYTTRSMRRLRPDPVPHDVQAHVLDAAIRAPSAGNAQNWRFVLVDDPLIRAEISPFYSDSLDRVFGGPYAEAIAAAHANPAGHGASDVLRLENSSRYLAEHFEQIPLLLFGFVNDPLAAGTIFPAIWNAQLAGRIHGLGSTLTMILGLFHREEIQRILAVPPDSGWEMACCVAFGYPTGTWAVAQRKPVHEVSYRNRWGADIGFEVPAPLWSRPSVEQ